ncbi:hypothetical protein C8034_v012194 [Colletotrichum sidae]|uniref:Uncharacterized protein n=1 Tax=Colletotrichum sidae TaxID=1347389 RepID=A0A4R8THG7_9PEZI|nr:hypothetical protein C8034_v012194 [Colletotrichum sidae]
MGWRGEVCGSSQAERGNEARELGQLDRNRPGQRHRDGRSQPLVSFCFVFFLRPAVSSHLGHHIFFSSAFRLTPDYRRMLIIQIYLSHPRLSRHRYADGWYCSTSQVVIGLLGK